MQPTSLPYTKSKLTKRSLSFVTHDEWRILILGSDQPVRTVNVTIQLCKRV